jgi:hypothetical protein
MVNIFDQQMLLMYGNGIPHGSLKNGNAPSELLALYQTWLDAIFETKHPGYYAKHVAIYFIYKGVRYDMDRHEFDEYVFKDGREGTRTNESDLKVDSARAEALFDSLVYPDLLKLGIPKIDILQSGSFD